MSEHDEHQHGHGSVQFEPTDVASKPVIISVLSLVVFTITFTAAAHLTFKLLAARERATSPQASPLAAQYGVKEPPMPRLQIHPKDDLTGLRAGENKVLTGYAWVDKDAGVVQVPIERAMEMLLAKGLPAREGPVPIKMQPKGVAPRQMGEGEGAPDWRGAAEGGEPASEPAAGKHGH